jgi:hypothetical protein
LATIFVVTAAYSLLLGGLTALDVGPVGKVIAIGLISLVAVCQALFHGRANPRGVSVLTGMAANTLFSWVLWATGVFPDSFLFLTIINGLLFGGLLGYIAGVLVGGMFLCADALRQKSLRGESSGDDETAEHESATPQDTCYNEGKATHEQFEPLR